MFAATSRPVVVTHGADARTVAAASGAGGTDAGADDLLGDTLLEVRRARGETEVGCSPDQRLGAALADGGDGEARVDARLVGMIEESMQ